MSAGPVCLDCGAPATSYTRRGPVCAVHAVPGNHRRPELTVKDFEAELSNARRADGSWDLAEVERIAAKYKAAGLAVGWDKIGPMMARADHADERKASAERLAAAAANRKTRVTRG